MGNRTVLYQTHLDCGAKMVDFGGWDMPIHYGSQIEEHHTIRQQAGMFDVSHMTVVDIWGSQAKPYLQYLLANDVARLKQPGKALYSGMLNPDGGVIDDLIVYWLGGDAYRLVVNCATREKDMQWLQQQAEHFDVSINEQPHYAMLAIQGPLALARVAEAKPEFAQQIGTLNVFQGQAIDDWFIARTGYTGEDGLEIILPQEQAADFWQQLFNGYAKTTLWQGRKNEVSVSVRTGMVEAGNP